MAEVYVTLGEAAELERVKYNTMVKRVLRKQESFVTKTEKSENRDHNEDEGHHQKRA